METKGDGDSRPAVVYLARDLFFGVKIADTATRLGWRVVPLGPLDDPAVMLQDIRPNVVFVDLQAPRERWLALLRAAGTSKGWPITTIAFGSHMDLAARAAALEAGASQVIANSKLASHLPAILAQHAPSASASR